MHVIASGGFHARVAAWTLALGVPVAEAVAA